MKARHWALACLLCVAGLSVGRASAATTQQQARQILAAAGTSGGLVVHLGCGEGRLTAALLANDRYLVHGLTRHADDVDKARRRVRQLGIYGKVSVDRLRGRRLPYTDNLVNLLVAEDPLDVSKEEIMRVLAPRGVALIAGAGAQGSGVGREKVEIAEETWSKIVKPWPDEIDHWTHYLHGSNNNATSMDTRVNPPQHIQWKAEPMWCRSHDGVPSSIEALVSAGGRIFCIVDEGIIGQPRLPQQWTLIARDAFNGILLWKRPLTRRTSRYLLVAMGDRVYVTPERQAPLLILDAATGETIQACEGTEGADQIVATEGVVVLGVRTAKAVAIVAVDAHTGRIRWKSPAGRILRGTLAAADGRVCYHGREEIVCLDLRNGEQLWRAESKSGRDGMLMIYRGTVLFTGPDGLQAFAAHTGAHLWSGPRVNKRLSVFGAGGLVWVSHIEEPGRSFIWTPAPVVAEGYDPRTGQLERTVESSHLVTPGHHVRCYPAKATDRYLLLPKRGVEFLDLEGNNHMRHNWLRAPCGFGVIPANGLLYVPPHQCFCYPGVKLTGFNVLAANGDEGQGVRGEESEPARLEEGPAYTALSTRPSPLSTRPSPLSTRDDWPTYRHDARRSGAIDITLPARIEPLWEIEIGGGLTPPVVAEGRLFVAAGHAHTVHCRHAASGEALWSYTAGGRIDSPPTVHEGLVLFGCTDGRVYCLRAATGELVWRFEAAPQERRVVAFGQLESAWPVHGSVLVQDGMAYFTAGRSSYLDGGIYAFAVEPKTGKVLHKTHLWSGRPDVSKHAGRPFDMEGARTDVLASDGTDLYMFHTRFTPDLTRQETPRITKLARARQKEGAERVGNPRSSRHDEAVIWTAEKKTAGSRVQPSPDGSGSAVPWRRACSRSCRVTCWAARPTNRPVKS